MSNYIDTLRRLAINARRAREALTQVNNRRVVFNAGPTALTDDTLFTTVEELGATFKTLRQVVHDRQTLEQQWTQQFDKLDETQKERARVLRNTHAATHLIHDDSISRCEAELQRFTELMPRWREAAALRLGMYASDDDAPSESTEPRGLSPFSARSSSRTPAEERETSETAQPVVIVETAKPTFDLEALVQAIAAVQTRTQLTPALPPATLPKFGGDPMEWNSFWQQFETMVDKQPLERSTKMTYLRAALHGDALLTIAALRGENDDYESAIETLRKCYGNRLTIGNALRTEIRDYQCRDQSINGLYRSWAHLSQLYKRLRTVSSEANCEAMGQIIAEKFPRFVRQNIYGKDEDDQPDADTVLNQIEKALRRERQLDQTGAKREQGVKFFELFKFARTFYLPIDRKKKKRFSFTKHPGKTRT